MADLNLDDLLTDPPATTATLHALKSVSIVGSPSGLPLTFQRGDTFEATPQLRRLNSDRLGRCSLDNTALFAPGPAPAGMLPAEGSPERADLHRARHAAAWRIEDRTQREAELARVRGQFGPMNPSRTLRENPQAGLPQAT